MTSGRRAHRRSTARRSAAVRVCPAAGLAQVARQPVPGEELVLAGGPGVDLAEAAQVAVVVSAEPVTGGAAVGGGQVLVERFPGTLAVITGRQRLQEQQPPSNGENLRGGQVPGGAQRGQPAGLDAARARGRAGPGSSGHRCAVA
jgi:hypothetical protein